MSILKKGISAVLASAMAFSYAACSGGNNAAPSSAAAAGSDSSASVQSSTPASTENVSLRFSWWGGDERNKATLDVIKQFEQKYPNITIEAEYGSSDGYNDKLATELAAGTAPDIAQIDPSYFPTYYNTNKDYFVDFQKQDIDLSGFSADYLKNNGNYDGKQLGLPTGVAGYAVIVNTDLASKFNIDLTKQYTWDDLISMGQKVKSADSGNYLLGANLNYLSDVFLRPYLQQLTGNKLLIDETKSLGITEDDLTQALTLIKKMYDNNVIPPESHMASFEDDNIPKDPDWISGKYVGALCVASTIDVLAAANTNASYTAGKLPLLSDAKDDGYYANCPQIMCVTAKSQHPAEAVSFLNYFFNDKDAAKTLGTTRSIPAVESSRKICEEQNLASSLTTGSVNTLLGYAGKSSIGYSSTSEVKSILKDAISSIAYGKSDPASASAATITLLENYLANQK